MDTNETILRPYIAPGSWVRAESLTGDKRIEEGIVYVDEEGTQRIAKPADADPYGPDGLPVQARWVGILAHRAKRSA